MLNSNQFNFVQHFNNRICPKAGLQNSINSGNKYVYIFNFYLSLMSKPEVTVMRKTPWDAMTKHAREEPDICVSIQSCILYKYLDISKAIILLAFSHSISGIMNVSLKSRLSALIWRNLHPNQMHSVGNTVQHIDLPFICCIYLHFPKVPKVIGRVILFAFTLTLNMSTKFTNQWTFLFIWALSCLISPDYKQI